MPSRIAWLVARHPVLVIVGALGFVLASGAAGSGILDRLTSGDFEDPGAESTMAADLLEQRFGAGPPNFILLVSARPGTVDDPGVARSALALSEELAAREEVRGGSRFREELQAGRTTEEAVSLSVQHAGRTLAFSAATLILALAALAVFPQALMRSFAYAGIAVVAIAGIGAVVVLPAVLRLLGPRVDKLAVVRRKPPRGAEGRWYRLVMAITRRPLPVAVLIGLFLVMLALPFRNAQFSIADDRALPADASSRQTSETIRQRFDTGLSGALAVVGTDAGDPVDAQPHIDRYARALSALGTVVAGPAAQLANAKSVIGERLPLAAAIIVTGTVVVLFFLFGSVVASVKAVILNSLSLTAMFGVIVWVFQEGNLTGLLDFRSTGTVDLGMPLLMFALAFGLSMDYELFILSRMREEYRTGDHTGAIAMGVQRTAGVLTASAGVLAVVFGGFAHLRRAATEDVRRGAHGGGDHGCDPGAGSPRAGGHEARGAGDVVGTGAPPAAPCAVRGCSSAARVTVSDARRGGARSRADAASGPRRVVVRRHPRPGGRTARWSQG